VLSTGYNGFPRNIEDTDERLTDRSLKYKYIVHAEKNVIYNATYNGVSLDGATIYVSGLPCCDQCALGITQVGVKRVVMDGDPTNPRWAESWELSKSIFNEANVEWGFV
jgi:dCMP deaminase